MKDSLLLLSSFIRKPKEVGAIAPSSKFLTQKIVNCIDFSGSKNIIELGPGSGTFTKPILEKSRHNTKLICFEVNKKFCTHLENTIDDDKLILVNSGAEKILDELKKLEIRKADCIVSGLPFRNFPDAKKHKILRQVQQALKENGKFILFQYTNGITKILQKYFKTVEKKFVALNVPPALVYICKK